MSNYVMFDGDHSRPLVIGDQPVAIDQRLYGIFGDETPKIMARLYEGHHLGGGEGKVLHQSADGFSYPIAVYIKPGGDRLFFEAFPLLNEEPFR